MILLNIEYYLAPCRHRWIDIKLSCTFSPQLAYLTRIIVVGYKLASQRSSHAHLHHCVDWLDLLCDIRHQYLWSNAASMLMLFISKLLMFILPAESKNSRRLQIYDCAYSRCRSNSQAEKTLSSPVMLAKTPHRLYILYSSCDIECGGTI